MRIGFRLGLALLALCAFWPLFAQEAAHTFVEVATPFPEKLARELSAEQFDVAGVDRERKVVGIVATAQDLARLDARGTVYEIRERSHPLRSDKALADYTSPAEMEAFLDQTAAAYPSLAKKVLLEDTLFEGQKVWAIKLTKDVDLPNLRPRFLLDAAHHAREVMTPEIAKDAIEYLTTRYATGSQVRGWLDNIEVWVVPIVNPDGLEFVFTSDNMWRKNRHTGCAVDNNRNYDFGWNACNGSSGVCSNETYRGTVADSEPETQAIVALTEQLRPHFALSYHSYGQYILFSYGCGDPTELTVLNGVAQGLNAILVKDNGSPGGWATGPIYSTIYNADGGSVDSQYGRFGALSYVIEVNTAFQPDYALWRNTTVTRQRTAWQYFLDKTLQAPQVRGRITDAATGAPLPATVTLQEVNFINGELPRVADSRGSYHWLVPASGTVNLIVSHPGYCTQTLSLAVGSGPLTTDISLFQPQAPLGLSATPAGDNAVSLSWNAVAGATQYRVYRALSPGGAAMLAGTVSAPITLFGDNPVSGGVTWYYTVRALAGCESSASSEIPVEVTGDCTLAPWFAGVSSVMAPPGATCALRLSWPAATGYCGGPVTYRVYRSTSAPFTPGPSSLIAAGLSGTSYDDHGGILSGATYYYTVRAVDAASGEEEANTTVQSGLPLGPLSPGTWSEDGGDTTPAAMTGEAPWIRAASGGNTAPGVYLTGAPPNNACAALTTPVLTLGASPALRFFSKYDLETNYDAGIVEVASGPAFTAWAKLTTVNYPDDLPYSGNACGFPTSGAGTAFSRVYTMSPPWNLYQGSLAAYANQQVMIRWRVSTDGGLSGKGWWVDDIQVTEAMVPGACAAGTPPWPQEAGSAAFPLTASRQGSAVAVSFGPACGALDHAAYAAQGPFSTAPVWSLAQCGLSATGRASLSLADPVPGTFWGFLVVGQDTLREGSYGKAFNGTVSSERQEATGLQGGCDHPQALGGSCP